MSTAAGRVFSGALRRRIFTSHFTASARLNGARPLALTAQRSLRSADEEEVKSGPIKFTTSKASHRTWKVEGSMGSQHQLPWWRILPLSLFTVGFLLFCLLRGETDADTALERNLYERLSNLTDEEQTPK